jgi:predicted nucleic acid-binding protein
MLLVVDTNIIISSLIKDSGTREILLTTDIIFVAPEWVHTEIEKHRELISQKAGINQDEMDRFINEIFQVVQTIPFSKYKSFIAEAQKIIGKIDKDDAPFIALAFAIDADGIWTNDKDFEKQNIVKIWKTKELVKIFIWPTSWEWTQGHGGLIPTPSLLHRTIRRRPSPSGC